MGLIALERAVLSDGRSNKSISYQLTRYDIPVYVHFFRFLTRRPSALEWYVATACSQILFNPSSGSLGPIDMHFEYLAHVE